MKKLIAFLFILALATPIVPVDAQSRQKDTDLDNLGEQIGQEIEKFVDQMTKRWDSQDDVSKQPAEEDTIPKKSRRFPDATESEADSNAHTFSGDKVIEASQTVRGNVVVKGGDLTVYGKVDGDVLVVGGDLYVKHTGKITGNARVLNGNIIKEDGAVIEGYEDKTSAKTASYRESKGKFTHSGHSFDVQWLNEQTNLDNFIFRYNRVESLFFGIGTEKKFYWDGEKNWNAYGSIGWGVKSHTWRGNLGLSRQFAISSDDMHYLFEIGAEGYSLTDTKDQWIVGQLENTLAAILIHEDFRDYFERNGSTVHAAFYTQQAFLKGELNIAYLADTYNSLVNKVDWAFFGGDKVFRLNPAIQPGRMRSAILNGGFSTVTKTAFGTEGWSIYATSEVAKQGWGSKFDFDQYIFDIRRFQPLGAYDNFNIRIRVGSLAGIQPDSIRQKSFDLGGLGTLNAFPFKSETGNRMIVVNAEFMVNGSFLDDIDFWPTWLFRHVNLIFLSDAGFTRTVSSTASATEGFDGITWGEFHHDFGIAFANRSGSFRIGITWRTDHPEPAQFLLRISRPF